MLSYFSQPAKSNRKNINSGTYRWLEVALCAGCILVCTWIFFISICRHFHFSRMRLMAWTIGYLKSRTSRCSVQKAGVCVFVCVCKSIFTFMLFLICCSEFVFLHHSYVERITDLSQQRTILELFDKADDILLLCSGEVQRRNTIYFSSLYFFISSNSWCKLGWIIDHSICFLRIMISAKVILELWFFPMKYPSWMDQRSILFLELLQLDLLTVSFPSGYFKERKIDLCIHLRQTTLRVCITFIFFQVYCRISHKSF